MKLFALLVLVSATGLYAALFTAEKSYVDKSKQKDLVRRFGNQVMDFREWFESASFERYVGRASSKVQPSKRIPGPTNFFLLDGKILQVVSGGLLVDVGDKVFGLNESTKIVMLENYPQTAEAFDGKLVSCVAKASGRYQYRTTSGSESTVEKYDYGTPLSQEEIARIDRDKIAAIRASNEALAQTERERVKAMTPRVVAYQQQQASNGSVSFQLELGKRYMRGDGVETNLALALHWLQAACTNGESQASNLLMQLKSNGTK